MDGISPRNDFVLFGTAGRLNASFINASIEGKHPFQYDGPTPNPAVEAYRDTLNAIRSGRAINEGVRIAQSTMTAVIGAHGRLYRTSSEVGLGHERFQTRFNPNPLGNMGTIPWPRSPFPASQN